MPNVNFSFRRGAGDVPEILYGKVEIKPTLAFARGTSLVLPAPTTLDLVNGEATANNVYPTPAPVAGQVEWAYRVKAIDTRGQSFEWMVGVPDGTGTVEFTALPRYFETKPPLFGEGPQGVPGEAAKITVGAVTGGATASVTNSGTNQNAVLDFVLPKGDKGDKGDGVPSGGSALQYIRKDASGAVTEWATLDKSSVGLSNVDNTADADKPVSTAQQTAIDNRGVYLNSSKLPQDLPDSYVNGVSTVLGRVADGWPQLGTSEIYTCVTTFKTRNNSSGVRQVLSAYNDPAAPTLERLSTSDSVWGDFRTITSLETNYAYVSPEEFQVDKTGTVDASVAIQKAIDKGTALGLEVVIPKGIYRIESILRATGNGLKIRAAKDAVFLNYKLGSFFKSGARLQTIKGFDNIEISGGIWDARGVEIGDSTGIMGFGKSDNVYLHDMIWKNSNMGHMVEIAGCKNMVIERIKFSGYLDTSGNRNYAEAFQIERITKTGFPDFDINDQTACDGVVIRDCVQLAPDAGYSRWPVSVGTHADNSVGNRNSNILLENCDFGSNTFRGVRAQQWNNLTIRNVNAEGLFGLEYRGILDTYLGLSVENSKFTSTLSHAILLSRAVDVRLDNVTASGESNGIALESTVGTVISRSNVVGRNYDGILLTSSSPANSNVTVENTKIEGNTGFYLLGDSKGFILQGCEVLARTSNPVRITATSGQGVISGNTLKTSAGNGTIISFAVTAGGATITGNVYSSAATLTNGTAAQVTASGNGAYIS